MTVLRVLLPKARPSHLAFRNVLLQSQAMSSYQYSTKTEYKPIKSVLVANRGRSWL